MCFNASVFCSSFCLSAVLFGDSGIFWKEGMGGLGGLMVKTKCSGFSNAHCRQGSIFGSNIAKIFE